MEPKCEAIGVAYTVIDSRMSHSDTGIWSFDRFVLLSELTVTIVDERRGIEFIRFGVIHDLEYLDSWRFQTSQKRQHGAMVTEFQGVWVASSLRLILASRSQVGGGQSEPLAAPDQI